MKKKGKSNDEKKFILYDIMLESESFFILKELESLAPKKGIRSIFVKDLLQQLVDDDKVKSEKVGLQNVFWVLKTEESSILQNKYQELMEQKRDYEEIIKKEKQEYDKLMHSLKYSEEELQKQVGDVKVLLNVLEKKKMELQDLKKTDIKQIEKMKIQNKCAVESILRWNNNIFIVKQWIQNRTDKPGDIVDRLLGVKDIFHNWN
ncbi:meiotic nuclear division protein 1, putative [Plasmodium reichenowi]|uniref:Meiotic nuclear division protein 1, putative n=1 Tax=Plasmodium reichenowi TaxID=5854 RepID=A0A060S0M0_PLARE|nr:meiotic nuclear division protein 1, putative [Plasmodium reichenowi]KYN94266.1 meiotic nuclear division protein 1, putative [Plasmodium reichenowi]CDO67079.1 meiotic nuclear division protein 1, putative [Plasmodium reichenowi]SOV83341.1 meiotic nuclear division protein 1, putative [Plasmodium reichenowi]